jgi:hypothetical protein
MFWAIWFGLCVAFGGEPEEARDFVWEWPEGRTHSWYLHTEVQLPSAMWFVADTNKQARVAAFQVEFVMTCRLEGAAGKRSLPLRCAVDDIAIRAAALPGDAGVLPEILAEMDEKLSVAELQLVLRTDGRLRHVDLENVDKRNRRISQMHENMRLVLVRALAGFDLRLPRSADLKAGAWPQYEAELMKLPSSIGTIGAMDLAHKNRKRIGDLVPIDSSGRGMMSASGAGTSAPDIYAINLEARGVFDTKLGILRERRWTVLGMPTASSAMAEGGEGIPYGQRGFLSYIPPGQTPPTLGETMEVAPPGVTQTAIHPWTPLGRPAGAR